MPSLASLSPFDPIRSEPGRITLDSGLNAAASVWRLAAMVASSLLALLLVGCAALPPGVQRQPSLAIVDAADTELSRAAQAALPAEPGPLSGFRLLPGGDEAFATRLALAHKAQKSLDVQYYLIAADAAGAQFLRALRDAAARGVRVRLLVDDLHAVEQDERLASLAAHPQVEVRLFNPLPLRSPALAMRVLASLHEFERVNRRMHNKLFIADNAWAVTGGRNIGNEYFMRGESANFIDMDVLAAGPAVRELSQVFDRYWNSELAFPIASLTGPALPAGQAQQRFDALVAGSVDLMAPERVQADAALAGGNLKLHLAPARVLADVPSKALLGSGPDLPATALDDALELLRQARSEVLIASPYFVPGPRGLALMREAKDKGVRVAVMTNSAAATDEPLAYWAYVRYRLDMLRLGVDLSEFNPQGSRQVAVLGEMRSSLARLHAKVAVADRRWLVVGSMNMDGRSSRSNTELGLAIDSPELAAELAATLQQQWLAGNYRLRMSGQGERIEWVATENERDVVHRVEPQVDWFVRLRLGLLSAFVSEDLL